MYYSERFSTFMVGNYIWNWFESSAIHVMIFQPIYSKKVRSTKNMIWMLGFLLVIQSFWLYLKLDEKLFLGKILWDIIGLQFSLKKLHHNTDWSVMFFMAPDSTNHNADLAAYLSKLQKPTRLTDCWRLWKVDNPFSENVKSWVANRQSLI